jgi:hypothetical protein
MKTENDLSPTPTKANTVALNLSPEVAKAIYGNNPEMDKLLRENFTDEELGIKPKLPKRWEDIGEVQGWYVSDRSLIIQYGLIDAWDEHRNIVPTKSLAKAMLAMCQLLYLRDIYRQGWEPDWTDDEDKHSIIFEEGCVRLAINYSSSRPICFQSHEIRYEFFTNFSDLIEEAKELL